jgi:NTE family protein
LLARLDTLSGVSAGALCSAWIGLTWPRLQFDSRGVAANLDAEVIGPLRAFAQNRIGIRAALASFAAPLGWASTQLVGDLNRLLFRGATLADLTPAPRVILSAVELATAEPVRFSHHGGWHAQHGKFSSPQTQVASAVAASCAYPPFFAPAILPVTAQGWRDAADGPGRLLLCDGVLEDNTGLEAVWPHHDLLLLSDASLPCKLPTPIRPLWHSILLHTQRVQFHHGRLSRLARLREQFAAGLKRGAYWGLSGDCFGGESVAAIRERGANPGAETEALWRIAANFVRLRPEVQQSLERQSQALCARALAALGE